MTTLTDRQMRDYKRLRREHSYPAAVAYAVTRNAGTVRDFLRDHVEGGPRIFSVELDNQRYVVDIDRDDTYSEPDGDCYNDADIDAWRNDRWHYYSVTVTHTATGGEDSLGGIDAGDYFEPWALLDTEGQVWSLILDHAMLDNAREAGEKAGHRFVVTVDGCTRKQAEQVMRERIGVDEDYGFAYSIDWTPA